MKLATILKSVSVRVGLCLSVFFLLLTLSAQTQVDTQQIIEKATITTPPTGFRAFGNKTGTGLVTKDSSGNENTLMLNVDSPTLDNILTTDADGQATDSGKAVNDSGTTTSDIWTADKIISYIPVTSVFGRTGVVTAATSDYDADQVDFDPSTCALTSTNIEAALCESLFAPLNVSASVSPAVAFKSYFVDASGGAVNIALPDVSASTDGQQFRIYMSIDTNDVTITTVSGTDLIGDSVSQLITAIDTGITVIANNTVGKYEIIQDSRPKTSDISSITYYGLTESTAVNSYLRLATTTTDPDFNPTTASDLATGPISGADQLIASLSSAKGTILGTLSEVNASALSNIRRTVSGNGVIIYVIYYRRLVLLPTDHTLVSGEYEASVTNEPDVLTLGALIAARGTAGALASGEWDWIAGTLYTLPALDPTAQAEDYVGAEYETGISNNTTDITTDTYEQFSVSAIITSTIAFTENDKFVIKIFGTKTGTGTDPEFDLQFEGLTPARTTVAVPSSSIAHDSLAGVLDADTGVLHGHINATSQTIAGIKTFSSFSITPSSAPTTDYQVANKKYVDDADALLTTGAASSTDNAISRFDSTTGKLLQNSLTLITDLGKMIFPDIATTGIMNITARSVEPSAPASGDIYLDDGTNTTSGETGLRHYTGSVWEDISGGGSGGNEVSGTFVDGDLSSGILTIVHTFGTWYPSGFSIYDNNNILIPFGDDLTVSNNTLTVDLSSFGTLSGTWRYYAGDAVSSASTTFTGLTDTPSSYSGQAGKLAAVNSGETGLEFIDAPSGGGGTPILTSISGESFIYPKTSIINPFSNAANSPNITFDVDNYADTVALVSTSSNEPMQLYKFKIPADTTSLKYRFVYSPETGNSWSSETVIWKMQYKKMTDNVAWSTVTSKDIGTDTVPSSGTAPQLYEVSITLATLGLAVGDVVQSVIYVDSTSTWANDVAFQFAEIEVVQ